MDYFKILGIEPTNDTQKIKKAYAEKLKGLKRSEFERDVDAEEYDELRNALNYALTFEKKESDNLRDTSVQSEIGSSDDESVHQVDAVFKVISEWIRTDWSVMYDINPWDKLLKDNDKWSIDVFQKRQEYIIQFLEYYYYVLSKEVSGFLVQKMNISESQFDLDSLQGIPEFRIDNWEKIDDDKREYFYRMRYVFYREIMNSSLKVDDLRERYQIFKKNYNLKNEWIAEDEDFSNIMLMYFLVLKIADYSIPLNIEQYQDYLHSNSQRIETLTLNNGLKMLQTQQYNESAVDDNKQYQFAEARTIDNYLPKTVISYLSGLEYYYNRKSTAEIAEMWKFIPIKSYKKQPRFMIKKINKYREVHSSAYKFRVIAALVLGLPTIIYGFSMMKEDTRYKSAISSTDELKKNIKSDDENGEDYKVYNKDNSDEFVSIFFDDLTLDEDKAKFIKHNMTKSLRNLANGFKNENKVTSVDAVVYRRARYTKENTKYSEYRLNNDIYIVVEKSGQIDHVYGNGWETIDQEEHNKIESNMVYSDIEMVNSFIDCISSKTVDEKQSKIIKYYYSQSALNAMNNYQIDGKEWQTKSYSDVKLSDKRGGVIIEMRNAADKKDTIKYIITFNRRNQIDEIYGPSFSPMPKKYSIEE